MNGVTSGLRRILHDCVYSLFVCLKHEDLSLVQNQSSSENMETEHWIRYYTEKGDYEEGIPYYYNKETGITQFEEPNEFRYQSYCLPQVIISGLSFP